MQLVGIMWIKVAPMVVVATATIFQLKHAISVYEFWRGLLLSVAEEEEEAVAAQLLVAKGTHYERNTH